MYSQRQSEATPTGVMGRLKRLGTITSNVQTVEMILRRRWSHSEGKELQSVTDIVSPETVMACAILEKSRADEPVLIEDVSGLFAKLRDANIEEVGTVALRRRPHGLYSEDVEAFFGRLLAAGFAQASSPLKVNDEGLQLCLELVTEENQAHPGALQKVAQVLGFDLSLLNNQAPRSTRA